MCYKTRQETTIHTSCIRHKTTYWQTTGPENNTLYVITSAKSIICRLSMLIPWLAIVYCISSIIHLLAASIPSVCSTSMTWLLFVLLPSTPGMPMTAKRFVLQNKISHAPQRKSEIIKSENHNNSATNVGQVSIIFWV